MLAALYIGYVILLAKWKPELMPPLSESEQRVPLPGASQALAPRGANPLFVLPRVLGGAPGVRRRTVLGQLIVTLIPALAIAAILFTAYRVTTAPVVEASAAGLIEVGGEVAGAASSQEESTGLIGAPESEEPAQELVDPAAQEPEKKEAAPAATTPEKKDKGAAPAAGRVPPSAWFYVLLALGIGAILLVY